MTYDEKAEAEIDAFAAALNAAYVAGRESMREEAAAFVERVSDRNDESEIGEQITEDGYNAAPYTAPVAVKLEFHGRALAAAIRALPVGGES